MAYDIYNGLQALANASCPGPARGQRVARRQQPGGRAAGAVRRHAATQCLRLDPATGADAGARTSCRRPPGGFRRWGMLADGGKLLYGTPRRRHGPERPRCSRSTSRPARKRWTTTRTGSPTTRWPSATAACTWSRPSVTDEQRQAAADAAAAGDRARCRRQTRQRPNGRLAEARRSAAWSPWMPHGAGPLAEAAGSDALLGDNLAAMYHDGVAGPVRRVPGRPLLAAVLCRRVRRAAGHRAGGRRRPAAVVEAGRLSGPAADRRRHAARRAVGVRSADRPAADAGASGDGPDENVAVRPARASLRLPSAAPHMPVLPLVEPGLLRPGRRLRHDALRRPAAGLLDQFPPGRRPGADAGGQHRLHVRLSRTRHGGVPADAAAESLGLVQRPGPD